MKSHSWREVEELFHRALERDRADRDAYVHEACHGNSELERDVSSLLVNHNKAGDLDHWAEAVTAELIGPDSLEPGQFLAPYRIDSFLAAGGMGEVYRATDTRLNREVAIKSAPAGSAGALIRKQRSLPRSTIRISVTSTTSAPTT